MNRAWLPTPAELGRETLIVIGGAVLAALIIGHVPALRDWIKEAWGTPSGH
ncbi:MAG TPA: hypothetical protein PLA33_02630 [Ottowia sp.]|nr:hypothetical protein [Ottowia sp.]HNI84321.1 hypothetical protein [Ottowia sp.]HNJ45002.1 hypothetical protein [Ottowia sp.]HNK53233.1 hypothetical protein [Ottowia sp.]HNL40999.1 hypothetical protein [Ottowia sp.]